MCLFHSTSLKIYITNATSNNQNNPASFKIEVQITIGGVTQTYTSDTVILPDFGPQLDYGGSADNRGTLRNGKFHYDETSTVSTNFQVEGPPSIALRRRASLLRVVRRCSFGRLRASRR